MHDALGDRMKRYEQATRTTLTPRTPVIIRCDGKAFHTLTRGLPAFDQEFGRVMAATTEALCGQVQGCVFGYVQSDEISLLLHTYKRFASSAWFDGQVQKIVSVAAGIASSEFTDMYCKKAVFDARAFVLPECEVSNYFIWRQQDCIRNSVQMMARSKFSHKQCHGKNVDELKAMLAENGTPWDDLAPHWKYGLVCRRKSYWVEDGDGGQAERSRWQTSAPEKRWSVDGYSYEFKHQPALFDGLEGLLATEE